MTVARSPDDTHAAPPPVLANLLRLARLRGASDVHWRSGAAPWLRVMGHLQPLSPDAAQPFVLTETELRAVGQACFSQSLWRAFCQGQEIDAAWNWPDLGRYRVNAFACESGCAMVLRCIADAIPDLAQLQAPPGLVSLLTHPGLVLVTGPTGSGKSTTLAAMVKHLNHRTSSHILTLEDPIEYVHPCASSLITQREIGRDSAGFAQALRAALREDPDVLLIGEMRDLDTIRLALTAAETGHLVLASLHTRHAASAIERIVDVFEAAEKALVRTQLADALRGVLAQSLHPRADGQGRVALFELLVATPAVRNLIREGKTAQIASAMQAGAAHGMVTLAQSTQQALKNGWIVPTDPPSAR